MIKAFCLKHLDCRINESNINKYDLISTVVLFTDSERVEFDHCITLDWGMTNAERRIAMVESIKKAIDGYRHIILNTEDIIMADVTTVE